MEPHVVMRQHSRASNLRLSDFDAFAKAGVTTRALKYTACGIYAPVRRAQVSFDKPPLCLLVSDKVMHLNLVKTTSAYTIPVLDRSGKVADILAWRPNGEAGLWMGHVAMAGEEQLSPRGDVVTHATVLAWLLAGRRGVVDAVYSRPRCQGYGAPSDHETMGTSL